MAKISKPFQIFCWFLGVGFPAFVLVLALTSFDSTHASSTAPSPSPPSHASTCDVDALQRNISILLRYLVSLILTSLLLMAFVRAVAEAASKDHERVAAKEDAYYKAAWEEVERVKNALQTAEENNLKRIDDAPDNRLVPGVDLREDAVEDQDLVSPEREVHTLKVELTDATDKALFALPKEGIARLDGWWKIFVRGAFLLAVGCSFGAAGIASLAFYSSLQIKLHCVRGPAEIFTFVIVGAVSTAVHVFFAWVAISQD